MMNFFPHCFPSAFLKTIAIDLSLNEQSTDEPSIDCSLSEKLNDIEPRCYNKYVPAFFLLLN